MLVIGILLIILTSLNCEELQCANGELKNNGQLVETNTKPLQQGLFCGWQLEVEPSCKSVIITAKYVKRNEKRKCELMDDNISFNCYCEGDLCNKDAKKLYDILMSRYLVQGNNTKTGAEPTVRLYKTAKASQMLYCALATMQTEYNYHDVLPKPSAQVFDQLTEETTQSENPRLEESDIIGVDALILIVVLVVLFLAICLLGCYLLRKCKRRKAEDSTNDEDVEQIAGSGAETVGTGTTTEGSPWVQQTFGETCITDMSKLQSAEPTGKPTLFMGSGSETEGQKITVRGLKTGFKPNSDTTHSSNPTSEFSSVEKGGTAKKGGKQSDKGSKKSNKKENSKKKNASSGKEKAKNAADQKSSGGKKVEGK